MKRFYRLSVFVLGLWIAATHSVSAATLVFQTGPMTFQSPTGPYCAYGWCNQYEQGETRGSMTWSMSINLDALPFGLAGTEINIFESWQNLNFSFSNGSEVVSGQEVWANSNSVITSYAPISDELGSTAMIRFGDDGMIVDFKLGGSGDPGWFYANSNGSGYNIYYSWYGSSGGPFASWQANLANATWTLDGVSIYTPQAAVVPLPPALAMLGLGLAALLGVGHLNRRRQVHAAAA